MTNEIESLQKPVVPIPIHNETALNPWVTNPYLKAATSDNTRKAYRSDIKHYEQWGGLLPAIPEKIIQYLNTFADKLNSRTLSRRLVAIGNWHTYQGFPDPTSHPMVAKTMVGINRVHGKPKDKAPPLSPEDLIKMANALSQEYSLMNIRDNAIIQIGYFGALRRSEIINIHFEHLNWKTEGLEILLPHSKTDQSNEGQYCAIPYGNEILCPVKALKDWLEKSGIQSGAVFRRIFKNNILSENSLTPLSLNHIVKRCAVLGNLENANKISPHSLRRGLATSAARANASIKTIMRAGRWKQVNTVMEYIEASERFSDSAAASVLENVSDITYKQKRSGAIMKKPPIKNKELFSQSGTDELYQILQSETLEWHIAAKNYWQKKYNTHFQFLDKNFSTELPNDTFSRLWELTQIDYLSDHSTKGLKLIEMVGKQSKPDFCFEINGQRFYHEAVCASAGVRPELLVDLDSVSGKARRTPIPEYMESVCSALREKAEKKYHGKNNNGYKAYMEDKSGLIIALSTSKIPFHNQVNNFNIDLSCIFGMSPLKIPLIPKQDRSYSMGEPYHDFQPTFNKKTNKSSSNQPTPIKTDYFADDQFSHISAILLSHTGFVFFPDIDQYVDYCYWKNCRNDYTLIHNPYAITPFPQGILDVVREVTATITKTGIDIHVKNIE